MAAWPFVPVSSLCASGVDLPQPSDSFSGAAHQDASCSVDRIVTVLLVDDHDVVRIGSRQLIDSHADLQVCGEATTLAEARGRDRASEARCRAPRRHAR